MAVIIGDEADGSDDEHPVAKLLDRRQSEHGVAQYLVQWVGYGSQFNEWVNFDNLNCPAKVEEYFMERAATIQREINDLRERNDKDITDIMDVVNKNSNYMAIMLNELTEQRRQLDALSAVSNALEAQPNALEAQPNELDVEPNVLGSEPNAMDSESDVLDAEPNVMDAAPNSLDAEPNAMDPESNVLDAEPNVMDSESNVLDAEPNAMDPESNVLDAEPNVMDSESNVLDAEPNVMEAAPHSLDAEPNIIASANPRTAQRTICNHIKSDGQVCGAAFARKFGLKRHISRSHNSNVASLKCPSCPRLFKIQENLNTHKRRQKH